MFVGIKTKIILIDFFLSCDLLYVYNLHTTYVDCFYDMHYICTFLFWIKCRIFLKWFSNEDIHLAPHWAPKHHSTTPNFVADCRFVLVLAGLAQAIGWKTMAIRYNVLGCGGLIWGSLCAKWMCSLENHFRKLQLEYPQKKKYI